MRISRAHAHVAGGTQASLLCFRLGWCRASTLWPHSTFHSNHTRLKLDYAFSHTFLLSSHFHFIAISLPLPRHALPLQTEQLRGRTAHLRDLKAAAESTEAAKSRFVADTSHELRTPLNGLIGER